MTFSRLCQLAALALFLLPVAAVAQQGTVNYTVTTKVEVELPPELAHMQDQIPSESTSERVLFFNESETLTTNPPSEEDDNVPDPSAMASDNNVNVVIRTRGSSSEDETYVNLDTGQVVQKRDLLGRTFRINGEMSSLSWRLTGEQSEFLGYASQKAVAERDSTTYEAWFTSQIPISAGPEQYGGLPGLILVLTDGRQTFEATSVSLEPLAEGTIEPPSDGREVTGEEFTALLEERMRDLEESSGTFSSSGGASGTRSFRVIRRGN
ncbi:MAG: hypothetical protein Rubg2KO_31760 [Rubricoccaceae bacterium]